jgi:hypothetical protein
MHRGHNARNYHRHAPAPPERSYGAGDHAYETAGLFHTGHDRDGGCQPGLRPRPQDFQGMDGSSQRWF